MAVRGWWPAILNVFDNQQEGIRVDSGSAVLDLGYSTVFHNGFGGVYNHGSGVFIDAPVGRLHHNTVTYSADRGIELSNPGAVRVEANVIAHNAGWGLALTTTGAGPVIGNADLSLGLGNVVDDNVAIGILASGPVQVLGNTVSNTHGIYSYGILSSRGFYPAGDVGLNAVHDNYYGIRADGPIYQNRVYHNTGSGILFSENVYSNVVYSNLVGLEDVYGSGAKQIKNNVIYGNTNQGIYLHGYNYNLGVDIANNTVFQPQGDAVRVESGRDQRPPPQQHPLGPVGLRHRGRQHQPARLHQRLQHLVRDRRGQGRFVAGSRSAHALGLAEHDVPGLQQHRPGPALRQRRRCRRASRLLLGRQRRPR